MAKWQEVLRNLITGSSLRQPSRSREEGKLTRQTLLRMIEDSGAPERLHLAGCDLSGLDLSSDAIAKELAARRLEASKDQVPWYSMNTEGINLRGVDLANATLRGVNLKQAELTGADLFEADLTDANLRGAKLDSKGGSCAANLHDAKLAGAILVDARASGANLSYARLDDAYLIRADLRCADLQGARLRGTDLTGAQLQGAIFTKAILESNPASEAKFEGANFYGANLNGVYIDKAQLGRRIVQDAKDYSDPALLSDTSLPGRYEQGEAVYCMLKNNFLITGRYDDASWAHLEERRMGRRSNQPWNARGYHGDAHPLGRQSMPKYGELSRWHPLTWWFWCKYTVKWLLEWVMEVTCGYGERPGRALLSAIGVVFVLAALLASVNGIEVNGGATATPLDYFLFSAGAFTTIGFERLQPGSGLPELLVSFEAFLGITLLALVMFALGNRINRA